MNTTIEIIKDYNEALPARLEDVQAAYADAKLALQHLNDECHDPMQPSQDKLAARLATRMRIEELEQLIEKYEGELIACTIGLQRASAKARAKTEAEVDIAVISRIESLLAPLLAELERAPWSNISTELKANLVQALISAVRLGNHGKAFDELHDLAFNRYLTAYEPIKTVDVVSPKNGENRLRIKAHDFDTNIHILWSLRNS